MAANYVFYLDRRFRDLALFSIIFLLACIAGLIWMNAAGPLDFNRRVILGFATGLLTLFAFLVGRLLLAYCRGKLSIIGDVLTRRDGIRTSTISLNTVHTVVWRLMPAGGGVCLKTHDTKVVIHFGNYDFEDRLTIIQQLRSRWPESIQHAWPIFCHRIALPVRERIRADRIAACQPRRRLDDVLGITTVVLIAAAGLFSWAIGLPEMLLVPAIAGILWFGGRWLLPSDVPTGTETAERSQTKQMFYSGFFVFVVAITAVLAVEAFAVRIPHAATAQIGITGLAVLILGFNALRTLNREKRYNHAAAAASVKAWAEM